MNLKFKKLYATLAVGLLIALSFTPTLNTQATLTAPTTYALHYRPYDNPHPAPDFWELGNQARTSYLHDPTYTRSVDSSYYNYTTTLDNSDHVIIPLGLEITMTFNRSNTSWTGTGSGGYYPTDYDKIGSNNTVGTVINKLYLSFNNQTNKDYLLYLDLKSNDNAGGNNHFYSNYNGYDDMYRFWYDAYTYLKIFIPAYNTFTFYKGSTSVNTYFDAWYLQDLGVSDSYTNGFDNGYTQGESDGYDAGLTDGYDNGYDDGYIQGQDDADLLVTGFSAMVGILVNFVLMIVNLEVFGVSLMGLFSIVILFASIVWGLKLVRG